MVKKLVFDAQEAEGEADSIELTLNGTTHIVYRPTTGQTALMMASFSDENDGSAGMAGILAFYKDIMEPEGYLAIKALLRDPRVPDSLEQVMELTEQVIEAFTGNPTKQPTDYLPSRQSGGRSSTASRRQPASTRSSSPQRASATGSTRSSSLE